MPEHISDPDMMVAYGWMFRNIAAVRQRDQVRDDMALICDITVLPEGRLVTPKFVSIKQVEDLDIRDPALTAILDAKRRNPKARYVLAVLGLGVCTYYGGTYDDIIGHRQLRYLDSLVF